MSGFVSEAGLTKIPARIARPKFGLKFACVIRFLVYAVADPDQIELKRGPDFVFLALLAFLSSVVCSFFTQNKGDPGFPGPSLDPPLVICRLQIADWVLQNID